MSVSSSCTASAVAIGLMVVLGGTFFVRLATAPPPHVEIANYATSLRGRTRSQRHNARLAAQALNGKVVAPGAVFSFNRAVGSWSLDQGYVKAPVSFDGELVRAFGGGVCQTSTTLYNAVLLAGLPVRERHAHVVAPRYVPPGRDAAVAHANIDLRFQNPYPWPIRIAAHTRGEQLVVRLTGKERPPVRVHIATQVLSRTPPARLTRVASFGTDTRSFLRSPGVPGFRVVTHRVWSRNGQEQRRERLSDDTYPAMNRVVALEEP